MASLIRSKFTIDPDFGRILYIQWAHGIKKCWTCAVLSEDQAPDNPLVWEDAEIQANKYLHGL